ncbi:MAG: hypothetical protein CMM32_03690 [Rhodospirillaceae bacterium]|nr:hypothetical protein [Rhodospirillaceae bacterium]
MDCVRNFGVLINTGIFLAILFASNPVLAHGFAYKYDLPLPLNLYVFGSSSIVFVSFLMLLFWRKGTKELLDLKLSYTFKNPNFYKIQRMAEATLGTLSIMLSTIILCAGFFGNSNTLSNPLPVTIWVLWWVGFFYFTALCVNIWNSINPWAFSFQLAEVAIGKRIQLTSYPTWLGYWPSFMFFLSFVWIELVWPHKEVPATLATVITLYTLITWTGMTIYGKQSWLKYGECFSVIFTLIGNFSPIQFCKTKKTLHIQPPALGILKMQEPSMGLVFITILLLAGLSFDGFMATKNWLQLKTYLLNINTLHSIFRELHQTFGSLQPILTTLGLASTLLLFLFTYIFISFLTKVLINWTSTPPKLKVSLPKIVKHFVMTLLPIAIGYHIAHYLSYLLLAGQLIIPLASDPYALGWDLFNTNDYRIDIGIINAKNMWGITLVSVIIGHILSMFLSHVRASQLCLSTNRILIQLPLVTLMILYTGVSLWILAQPIVEL